MQAQAQAQREMHSKIMNLSVSRFDFKAKAKQLEKSATELSQECEKRTAECQAAIDGLRNNYAAIIAEASLEATAIKQVAIDEASTIRAEVAAEKAAWEAEKAKLAHIHTFKPKVKLDVGGKVFATSLATLRRFPDTMIGAMFSGRHQLDTDEDGSIFIDQDGTYFGEILNFLRKPEGFAVELPPSELKKLKRECEYYGLLEHMFPFTPAEPMQVLNMYNQSCNVTQDQDGLWYGNGVLMKICRKCFAADYAANAANSNYYYTTLQSFTSGKTVRELTAAQPEPDSCRFCG